MKCPICDAEMQRDDDYMDFTLMEREDKCVDGCGRYVEYFVTGNYEVGIKTLDGGWHTWQWSYASQSNLVCAMDADRKRVIDNIKAELKNELSAAK
jgi:YD repeat-containing protein